MVALLLCHGCPLDQPLEERMLRLVAKSCLTLVTPWTELHCPWDSPGENAEVGCHFASAGDLPYPVNEPGSPALQILYCLSYK